VWPEKTLTTLRVATWNVARPRPGSERAQKQRTHISDIDADVWVLTEAHRDFWIGEAYQLIAHSGRDAAMGAAECWVGIWSRVGGQARPTDDGERTAAIAIEGEGGQRTIVYGTVLPWLGSPWRGVPAAKGAAFAAALAVQSSEWQSLQHEGHLCVAGDLNQDLLADGHYYGSARNRADLESSLAAAALTCPTAIPQDLVRRHTGNAAAGTDHICLSRGLSLTPDSELVWPSAAERTPRLSDHFGASVRFAAS
jgi:hypothetical protein